MKTISDAAAGFHYIQKNPTHLGANRSGPDHIRIDADKAADRMLTGFHRHGMVSVFPEGSFPILSVIELLSGSTGEQLDGAGKAVLYARVFDKEMDMVGGNHIVQNRDSVPPPHTRF